MQSPQPALASLKKRPREQDVPTPAPGCRARSRLPVSQDSEGKSPEEREGREEERSSGEREDTDDSLAFPPTQVLSSRESLGESSPGPGDLSPEKSAFDPTHDSFRLFKDTSEKIASGGSAGPSGVRPRLLGEAPPKGDTGGRKGTDGDRKGTDGDRNDSAPDKENLFARKTGLDQITAGPCRTPSLGREVWKTGGDVEQRGGGAEPLKGRASVANPQREASERDQTRERETARETQPRQERGESEKGRRPTQAHDVSHSQETSGPPCRSPDVPALGGPTSLLLGRAPVDLPASQPPASCLPESSHRSRSCPTPSPVCSSVSVPSSSRSAGPSSSLPSSLPWSSAESSSPPSSLPASSLSPSPSYSTPASASDASPPALDVEEFLRRRATAQETGRVLLVAARPRHRVEAQRLKQANSGKDARAEKEREDAGRAKEDASVGNAIGRENEPSREWKEGKEAGETAGPATTDSEKVEGCRDSGEQRRCEADALPSQAASAPRSCRPSTTDIEDIAEWLDGPKGGEACPRAPWAPGGETARDGGSGSAPGSACGEAERGAAASQRSDATRDRKANEGEDLAEKDEAWNPLKSKHLPSVTDFSAQLWCERQLQFTLQTGIRRETIAMKKGSVRHLALELHHYQMEEIVVETEEEAMAFKLLNSIQQLQQLQTRGVCRELWVFGPVAGLMARGVIDELRIGVVESSSSGSASSLSGAGSSSRGPRPAWQLIPPGGGFGALQNPVDLALPDWERLLALDEEKGQPKHDEEGEETETKENLHGGDGWKRARDGERGGRARPTKAVAFVCPWEEERLQALSAPLGGGDEAPADAARPRQRGAFFTLLSDNKTRSVKKTPCLAQKQTSALQLQIYWHLVDRLRRQPLTLDLFFSAFKLDRHSRLTHPVLLACAEAAGVLKTPEPTRSDSWNDQEEAPAERLWNGGDTGSQNRVDEQFSPPEVKGGEGENEGEKKPAGPYLLLEMLLASLQEEFRRLPPLWKDVHVVYECEGEEFAREKIPYHAASVEFSLRDLTSWWRGLRSAEAVQDSEKWKCRSCPFLADCDATPLGCAERETALREQEEADEENKRALEEFDEVVALQQEQQRLQERLSKKRDCHRHWVPAHVVPGGEPGKATEAPSQVTPFIGDSFLSSAFRPSSRLRDAALSKERLKPSYKEGPKRNPSNAVEVSVHHTSLRRSTIAHSPHARSVDVTEKASTSLTSIMFKKNASRADMPRFVSSNSSSASRCPSSDLGGPLFGRARSDVSRDEQKDVQTKAHISPELSDCEGVVTAKTSEEGAEITGGDGAEKEGQRARTKTITKVMDRQDVQEENQGVTNFPVCGKQGSKEQGRSSCPVQRKRSQKGKKNEVTMLEGQTHITRYFATKNTGERKEKDADRVIGVGNK
ncbi:hypothetical protein NCLIV_052470 [Neospora caninum Liverpool]|uniref:Defects in morphology 1 n=1 Tax=Neospora caninum (strain Liverpool) TaxID=572307 RepID=F0VL69_NEOCL|nr:hypothetical protein NCLIV_052470 [Neospora caninum Liverpool]CBZ54821.1 hypothetical protein NCLIV_052470 [Neospora caninum Liverpool]|eukprot:XP_003884849.1 hypothetical protein NCLIV_052470 [Neospora caninum Liverpool]